jgi:hypothetical protein
MWYTAAVKCSYSVSIGVHILHICMYSSTLCITCMKYTAVSPQARCSCSCPLASTTFSILSTGSIRRCIPVTASTSITASAVSASPRLCVHTHSQWYTAVYKVVSMHAEVCSAHSTVGSQSYTACTAVQRVLLLLCVCKRAKFACLQCTL